MSQALHVQLTEEQRQQLEDLTRKGNAPARVQTRARILLLADRSQGEHRTRREIAQAAGGSAYGAGKICRRFVQEGLDAALTEKPRPGQAPKITGAIEAQLITLACSTPPDGQARWTLKMLSEKLIELQLVESISTVAVHKRLKKHSQTLESQGLVHSSSQRPVCR